MGWLCILAGIVLIICAANWMIQVENAEVHAGEAACYALAHLMTAIEDRQADSAETAVSPAHADDEPAPEDDMPVIEIDGYTYIGYLLVPELALELPVQADWSLDQLENSPCRYTGSLAGGNLIIAGHNYRRHFSPLKQLTAGSRVAFIDVNQNRYTYTVSRIITVAGDDAQTMLSDADQWDLTLFTCTYGGKGRLTLRCVLEDSDARRDRM